MPIERDYVEELHAIVDALAESVVEETDEQLLIETKESGQDPNVVLGHVKRVLHLAVKQSQQRPLREARKAYELRRVALMQASHDIPESADDRRALFMNIVAQNPSVSGMLTAQFREFGNLEDDDITSCLRQLSDLGLVNKSSESNGGD